MKHETLAKNFGLEDPRYKLRYNSMIATMLEKIREKISREFRFVLQDMRKEYFLDGKIHLTNGISVVTRS